VSLCFSRCDVHFASPIAVAPRARCGFAKFDFIFQSFQARRIRSPFRSFWSLVALPLYRAIFEKDVTAVIGRRDENHLVVHRPKHQAFSLEIR
jgi:hypothetical protein